MTEDQIKAEIKKKAGELMVIDLEYEFAKGICKRLDKIRWDLWSRANKKRDGLEALEQKLLSEIKEGLA